MGVEDAVEVGLYGVGFLPEVVIGGGLQVVAVGDQPVLAHAALAVEGVDRHHDGGVSVVLVALVEEVILILGDEVGHPLPMGDLEAHRGVVEQLVELIHRHDGAVKVAHADDLDEHTSDIAGPDVAAVGVADIVGAEADVAAEVGGHGRGGMGHTVIRDLVVGHVHDVAAVDVGVNIQTVLVVEADIGGIEALHGEKLHRGRDLIQVLVDPPLQCLHGLVPRLAQEEGLIHGGQSRGVGLPRGDACDAADHEIGALALLLEPLDLDDALVRAGLVGEDPLGHLFGILGGVFGHGQGILQQLAGVWIRLEGLVVGRAEAHEVALVGLGTEEQIVVEGVDTEDHRDQLLGAVVEDEADAAHAVAKEQADGGIVLHLGLGPPLGALPAVGGHTQKVQGLIAAVYGEVVPFHLADYAVLTANAEGNTAYGQFFIDRGMLEYLEHDISSLRLILAY